jgi:hypothetical protein
VKVCPTCPAKPGEYHADSCVGGFINYSDNSGRFVVPPTRRLLKWADCGPRAETMRIGNLIRGSASGEWTT